MDALPADNYSADPFPRRAAVPLVVAWRVATDTEDAAKTPAATMTVCRRACLQRVAGYAKRDGRDDERKREKSLHDAPAIAEAIALRTRSSRASRLKACV
jgi:hypothetical protein